MHNKGYEINHKTVLKLMSILGLKWKRRKNDKYHSYKCTVGKVADNLLKRDFHAEKSFEKITTDATQFNVCGEKIYLSPVLDLFNNEVISYSISRSPNLEQIREMLNGLFENCLPMQYRYYIQTKDGSTNTPNTNDYLLNIILFKVCHVKVILWITVLWKISLADLKLKCSTVKDLKALTLLLMN